MQLEDIRAELRSRPPYEAADLGVRLLRALFRPALWAWLGFVLPLQLCVALACSPFAVWTSWLAIWWLKPVYDRAFGLVLGRGLFGDVPTLRGLYRALWSAGRRGLLGDMLWRRLDPARTLVAPVALLEGLTGAAAARRRRTLGAGSATTVSMLLGACLMIEMGTLLGLVILAYALLPDEAAWIAGDLWSLDQNRLTAGLKLCAYALGLGLGESLFVAAGFGLYINRRTNLEGWDVELTFRRMARRLSPRASQAKAVELGAALALLLSLSGLANVERASAQADAPLAESAVDDALRLPAPEVDHDAGAAAAMARVLARPELQRVHVEERWELRNSPNASAQPGISPWLIVLAAWIARSFEVVLWALAAVVLAAAIYLLVQRLERRRARLAPRAAAAAFMAVTSVDAAQAALPAGEVVPSALALLAQGQHAAALSVLYAGTLAALVHQDQLEVPRQATEGQCLVLVHAAPIAHERKALFAELTQLWQLSAYAHARPADTRIHEICARFRACFGGAV